MPDYFFSDKKKKKSLEELCPSLPLKQRLIGFGICICIGFVLELIAWLSFPKLLKGEPFTFAICFSLGILVTLMGSAFLVGLFKQFRTMFHKKRIITTCVVLISLVMTLISALVLKNSAMTLIFMFIEIVAYTWYVLSFLPFAQTCVKKIFGNCLSS